MNTLSRKLIMIENSEAPNGWKPVYTYFPKKLVCGECGEEYDDEPRVEAGMKCSKCAYGRRTFARV